MSHARAIADWHVGSPRALNECEPRDNGIPVKGTPSSPGLPPASHNGIPVKGTPSSPGLPPASPKRRGHVSAAYAFPDDVTNMTGTTRVETDLLGSMIIPADALYGIATARAMDNYDISGVKVWDYPDFIRALAHVKRACATANGRLGLLPGDVVEAIVAACDELIRSDRHHAHFAVDMVQGGAGTSTNMCANEIIANLAAIHLGEPVGDYSKVHPNDHVNMCQSTNDAYPSAAKLAVVFKHVAVVQALENLVSSLRSKAVEFEDVVKMGRTQLQDAVPMTLGQEFRSFASSLAADLTFMQRNPRRRSSSSTCSSPSSSTTSSTT